MGPCAHIDCILWPCSGPYIGTLGPKCIQFGYMDPRGEVTTPNIEHSAFNRSLKPSPRPHNTKPETLNRQAFRTLGFIGFRALSGASGFRTLGFEGLEPTTCLTPGQFPGIPNSERRNRIPKTASKAKPQYLDQKPPNLKP